MNQPTQADVEARIMIAARLRWGASARLNSARLVQGPQIGTAIVAEVQVPGAVKFLAIIPQASPESRGTELTRKEYDNTISLDVLNQN